MWQSRQHEVVPLIFRLRISGLLSFNTSMQPSVNDCNDMSSVFVWYVFHPCIVLDNERSRFQDSNTPQLYRSPAHWAAHKH